MTGGHGLLLEALQVTFASVGKLCVFALAGLVPVWLGWVGRERVFQFTRFVIDAMVPVTIILSLVRAFSPAALVQGSLMIFGVVGWIIAGAGLGAVLFRAIPGGTEEGDRSALTLCSIQNSFYLPIPLTVALLPRELHSSALLYTALGLFATSPLQWTFGTYLLRGRKEGGTTIGDSLRASVSSPVIGVVIGVTLSFIPGLPDLAREGWKAPGFWGVLWGGMDLIAHSMGVVSMVVLGALVGLSRGGEKQEWRTVGIVAFVKLLAIPGVMYLLLETVFAGFDPLVKLMVMIQAASPPAVNLALAAKRFGGDWELLSRTQLPIYAASLVILPFWVALAFREVLPAAGGR